METGIYIHIPFCMQKCFYCDFLSFSGEEKYFEDYKDALIKEILNCEELDNIRIETIFFGGGTPTVLPAKYILEILNTLETKNILKNAEITIEANPGTLDESYLDILKIAGINRLSLGLQSFQDNLLKKIGRIHTVDEFIRSYSNAVKAGFDNINVDLMFSLPGQTLKDFDETLESVIELKAKHISIYSLIVEENTKFGKMYDAGKLILNDESIDRSMYSMAKKKLKIAGYEQYEISNFSLKTGDYYSRHNRLYWERGDYLGFGLGAHSFFNNIRYNNTCNINRYIEYAYNRKEIRENILKISKKNAMEEFMFLGLRMIKGISSKKFFEGFNEDIMDIYGNIIDKYVKQSLLVHEGGRIFLTERGVDVSNVIFSDFLIDNN